MSSVLVHLILSFLCVGVLCCTLSEQQQKLSSLQLQTEAESCLSLCVQQCPTIPQGFKLQRDNLSGRPLRSGTQSVHQTASAAAVQTHHIRG